jgi:hypothetical protein
MPVTATVNCHQLHSHPLCPVPQFYFHIEIPPHSMCRPVIKRDSPEAVAAFPRICNIPWKWHCGEGVVLQWASGGKGERAEQHLRLAWLGVKEALNAVDGHALTPRHLLSKKDAVSVGMKQ